MPVGFSVICTNIADRPVNTLPVHRAVGIRQLQALKDYYINRL